MSDLYTLDDLPSEAVAGRPLLVRIDVNVPMHGGEVSDRTRIREVVPTIRELAQRRAKQLLVAHLGRPKGQRRPELSLEPVARALAQELGLPVAFAEDCIGAPVQRELANMHPGGVCLLENVRFHPGEEQNDPVFARALASPASCYVSDAFGTAHRAHASTVTVPGLMPRRAAGRLIAHEVAQLSRLVRSPARPYVAVLGGAKIRGKIELVSGLVRQVDALLVGGGMANTFLAASGKAMGGSLVEREQIETAKELLRLYEEQGLPLLLPSDLVVTGDLTAASPDARVVDSSRVASDDLAVDIGPETIRAIARQVAGARTVFWNGPMGVFETPPFDAGSLAVAQAVAASSGFSVVGGGETAAVAQLAGVADRVGHVSTGGGAALQLVAGRKLPGIEVLRRGGPSRQRPVGLATGVEGTDRG